MNLINHRAISNVLAALVIILSLMLIMSFVFLNLSQNAESENNVTMIIHTNYAINGLWNGTITVSEGGTLVSVLIPTETEEISGVISDLSLQSDINSIAVTFEGLKPGTYPMIFTFRGINSIQDMSEFLDDVNFI